VQLWNITDPGGMGEGRASTSARVHERSGMESAVISTAAVRG
jgi:hypothetical protein